MITAETMQRIAPKQGDLFVTQTLEFTAHLLDCRGLNVTMTFLDTAILWYSHEVEKRQVFERLFEIMRSPEVIDEWTPVGGDTDG